ncbi:MAG: NRDE family protein [Candidatus Eisenbacteria bacterium]|uniref:NRDE family protein n=1 Tax=Eiseniibacteriota bacterium TaxID=2212470 RepID=A0A538TKL2_UNCEI|nr:MAG: NRDE family protein [Candidatus Eisenbacteria bacterium]
MCTLILGRDVVGPRTVILGANRDEDPTRPAETPRALRERPRVVGGRDVRAGGTWLAVREGLAVAMLNRRDGGEPAAPRADRRSRGLLTIDVATVPEPADAIDHARTLVARDRYAPFSLVLASPASCWWLSHDGDGPGRSVEVPAGWHVLTHMDLDDDRELRTVRLMRELDGFRPRTAEQATERLRALLGSHEAGAANPAVCLHQGRMVTVSSSLVWLAESEARYLHAEGRPCENPFVDYSRLLASPASAKNR